MSVRFPLVRTWRLIGILSWRQRQLAPRHHHRPLWRESVCAGWGVKCQPLVNAMEVKVLCDEGGENGVGWEELSYPSCHRFCAISNSLSSWCGSRCDVVIVIVRESYPFESVCYMSVSCMTSPNSLIDWCPSLDGLTSQKTFDIPNFW